MKIGLSNTPPKSEAIPLGTKRRRTSKRAGAARRKSVERATRDEAVHVQKPIDTSASSVVESSHLVVLPDSIPESTPHDIRKASMTLTLRSLSKNGKNAMYTGAAAVLRLPLAAFPDKQAPTAFVVDDVFAPARTPKVKLTKEERAALRASQPKPTEAERIAKAEARIAARKAKLAALEGQPAL